MVTTYDNWIGGRWVPARSGATRENIDPAHGEVLGIFPRSGADDVADAVSAADKSTSASLLRFPPETRRTIFHIATPSAGSSVGPKARERRGR